MTVIKTSLIMTMKEIEMKKLLLLTILLGFAAPGLFAETPHLVIYTCKKKLTEYGDEDREKKNDTGYMILGFDANGDIVSRVDIETWQNKNTGSRFYHTNKWSAEDLVKMSYSVAPTSETKKSVLVSTAGDAANATRRGLLIGGVAGANSVSGKVSKDVDVGEVNNEDVEVDVAKSLKGTGFVETDDADGVFMTWKTTYRMWSLATKIANGDEDDDANGDLDLAIDYLEARLEDLDFREWE
jgi:hypothetical protein